MIKKNYFQFLIADRIFAALSDIKRQDGELSKMYSLYMNLIIKRLFPTLLAFLVLSEFSAALAQDNASTNSAVSLKNKKDEVRETSGRTVNLSTGEVEFPVSLVSLDGRNGLSAKLDINYSSAGISKKISTWNLEAPTGVVGLGWSLDYPKIIVDNQQTGTREDDVFYISEGGQNIARQRINDDSRYPGWQIYMTAGSQRWKVKYKPTTERWEVTAESGTTFVYGDQNSGRNTIQRVVKWGNWIGNSSRTTDDNGDLIQQQQALVLNHSETINIWQEKIVYEHLNVNRTVGSGGREQTESSYLSKITDVFGRTIILNYQTKDSNEYQEPHTEQNEPDAYQETYENRYLTSVKVEKEAGKVLSTIDISYTSVGSGNLTKRLLTSIRRSDEADRSQIPSIYTYVQL